MRAANSLYRTGTVDLLAHTAAFVGQLATVQPLLWLSGGDPWAFTAYGLVMASIGVAATYLLARCFLGIGSSVLVALIVLVIPGFARQSASFMTDGPALALSMVCLLFGTKWLQGDTRPVTLVASLGAGLVAISIREFAITAPVAILTVAWVRSRPNQRLWLTALSGVLAVWVLSVIFLASIPSNNAQALSANSRSLSVLGPAFITLAAVVLPAAVLAMGPRIATFNPKLILLSAGLVGVMVGFAPKGPLIGNLWTSNGLGGSYVERGGYYDGFAGDFFLTGFRNPIFGMTVWNLSEQLATIAAILVAALVVRWGQRNLRGVASLSTGRAVAMRIARAPDAHLLLFLFLYGAGLAVYSSIAPVYDRYLYPMVPIGSILLLRRAPAAAGLGRSHAFVHAARVARCLGPHHRGQLIRVRHGTPCRRRGCCSDGL